ncbi:MAG: acylphosphatase [Deltaproteobacteria bacterium]|nr:acylphosphatase [Deltaproteobacteria bacterium]
MKNIRKHLIIEGRVQGVWFRESTRRQAVRLGVSGWVKNRPEGTVEALLEGPEEAVLRLVAWCGRGPSAAGVTGIHETEEPWRGEFDSFDVVY